MTETIYQGEVDVVAVVVEVFTIGGEREQGHQAAHGNIHESDPRAGNEPTATHETGMPRTPGQDTGRRRMTASGSTGPGGGEAVLGVRDAVTSPWCAGVNEPSIHTRALLLTPSLVW